MSIKGNIGVAPISLAELNTDTVLLTSSKRLAVTAFSLHNLTASAKEIDIYISPNNTSVSGKRVAKVTLAADESLDVNELIGQGTVATNYIIGVQRTTGAIANDVNCLRTYTEYSGDS